MLKTTSMMLAAKSLTAMEVAGSSILVRDCGSRRGPSQSSKATMIATFTAGPARATTSSWLGFSGMRSRLAMPPNGHSVTSRVGTPK